MVSHIRVVGDRAYFTYDGLEGDARIDNGEVVEVNINHVGVELTKITELKIALAIREQL